MEWFQPVTDGQIEYYRVNVYKRLKKVPHQQIRNFTTTDTSVDIDGLQLGTNYSVTVKTVVEGGEAVPEATVDVSTVKLKIRKYSMHTCTSRSHICIINKHTSICKTLMYNKQSLFVGIVYTFTSHTHSYIRYACARTHTYTCTHTCTHTHPHTPTHTDTQTHTHIIYTQYIYILYTHTHV